MTQPDYPPYDHDDALIAEARRLRQPQCRVYPFPETVVVLGRGSDAAVELNRGILDAHGVPVLRRRGGGCSVVLDPGNAVASVALPTEGFTHNQAWFDNITRWMIDGLRRIGIDGVYHDGISDLVLDDRKVGGSCIHRTKDVLYYSISLLVQADLHQIASYLRHPPKEPPYRRGRKHIDFITSLAQFPVAVDVRTFAQALERALDLRRLRVPAGLTVAWRGPWDAADAEEAGA